MDEQDLEYEDGDEKCVICGGDLDPQSLTCDKCVAGLSEEKFQEALEKCLQDVFVIEILHLPGIYEIIREEYNNEALEQAYQDMVDACDPETQERDRKNLLLR